MCRLRNIDMRDYQESATTGQTDGQIDTRHNQTQFKGKSISQAVNTTSLHSLPNTSAL